MSTKCIFVLCIHAKRYEQWISTIKFLLSGWLGGSAVEHLPLAQGMIPESWDRVPHRAPRREPASLPRSLPLSLYLS